MNSGEKKNGNEAKTVPGVRIPKNSGTEKTKQKSSSLTLYFENFSMIDMLIIGRKKSWGKKLRKDD